MLSCLGVGQLMRVHSYVTCYQLHPLDAVLVSHPDQVAEHQPEWTLGVTTPPMFLEVMFMEICEDHVYVKLVVVWLVYVVAPARWECVRPGRDPQSLMTWVSRLLVCCMCWPRARWECVRPGRDPQCLMTWVSRLLVGENQLVYGEEQVVVKAFLNFVGVSVRVSSQPIETF